MNLPYTDEAIARLYQGLFCDDLALYDNIGSEYPWNALFSQSTAELGGLLIHPSMDARIKLLAARELRLLQLMPPINELLGVVVEIHLPEGLDTLAAYRDGKATYINHSEKVIFWETETPESKKIVDCLFSSSNQVVKHLSPWQQERLAPPQINHLRINFLASHGLYFGQGPTTMLFNDAFARPALLAASDLMRYLIDVPPNSY